VPFTLAHAAAAFPLRRSRLILSALIIGTFAPDFEFFLRFTPGGSYGHTLPGIFLFSLPTGFIVFHLFHLVVKEPLAALMPESVRLRIAAGGYPLFADALQTGLVLISILTGALTHVLWDSFTHASYLPERLWPILDHLVTLPSLGPEQFGAIPLYKLLQYLSTLAGALAVYLWFIHWQRTAPLQQDPAGSRVTPSHIAIARVLIPLTALAGAFIRAQLGAQFGPHFVASPSDDVPALEVWLGDFAVTAISLAWLELLAWGLILERPPVRDLPPTTTA
jgi:uncharacterized protein DUF4184